MNKDIWQYDCLEYMKNIGVEVVEMEDLHKLFQKYGGMEILEMALRGGSSNGMIVRDSFEDWDLTVPFDTDQQFVLVIPGPKGKRMASIYLYDAEGIIKEMYRLDEFEEWNANRLWTELEDVPFIDEDGDMVLDVDWHGFPAGTPREDIWRWFDRHHPKGVAYLLYGEER